jgi:hypothetical protein
MEALVKNGRAKSDSSDLIMAVLPTGVRVPSLTKILK